MDLINSLKKQKDILKLENDILSENYFKQNFILKNLGTNKFENAKENFDFKKKYFESQNIINNQNEQIKNLKFFLENKNKENFQIKKINNLNKEKIENLCTRNKFFKMRNENLKKIIVSTKNIY